MSRQSHIRRVFVLTFLLSVCAAGAARADEAPAKDGTKDGASEKEYEALMYPVAAVFDWDRWQDGFDKYWRGDEKEAIREIFRSFKRQVLENFKYYVCR